MKVVAFLPAKGTSDRIPNKNLQIMDGKPLFLRQLERILTFECIDEVYLDTESEEIIRIASHLDCKILKRDLKFASNKTDGNQLLFNEARQVEADLYIQILCTSPFITEETITKGIEYLKRNREYDSAVLVKREKQYTWDLNTGKANYSLDKIPNSSDLPDTIIETMGLYIVRKETAFKLKRRIGENPYFLFADALESCDVNTPDEFELANFIAAGIRESERRLFRNLTHMLSSSMLSDIFEELHINNKIIIGMQLNLPSHKILGRAKTLKIKSKEDSDENSIYDALDSYQTLVPNDIIVVENECPEYAYFGELNSNLAIRSGVIGAIIGGKTRDSNEVKKMKFPVFSMGYSCMDIKKKGTLADYNKPISISGVLVHPNDLIFADKEGVVIIPQDKEKIVLKMAQDTMIKEHSILSNVAEGMSISQIRKRFGDF